LTFLAGARKSTPSDGKAPPPSMMPSRIMDFDLSAIERMGQDDPEDEDVDEDDPELLVIKLFFEVGGGRILIFALTLG
jgi:hypothetical protein